MKILAIETVTKMGGLSLVADSKIVASVTIDTQLRHAANIINSLDSLLEKAAVKIKDIDAIAVDVGPGSFTGIRVGIACASGLGQPEKKLLIGVCSLEILKAQGMERAEARSAKCLIPIIDAKRGELYVSWYLKEGKDFVLSKQPYITTSEELLVTAPAGSFIFGPEITKFSSIFKANEKFIVAGGDLYPQAETLALIAEEKIVAGYKQKPVVPLYVYDKIVTKEKK